MSYCDKGFAVFAEKMSAKPINEVSPFTALYVRTLTGSTPHQSAFTNSFPSKGKPLLTATIP